MDSPEPSDKREKAEKVLLKLRALKEENETLKAQIADLNGTKGSDIVELNEQLQQQVKELTAANDSLKASVVANITSAGICQLICCMHIEMINL
jgi:cell division protein FtsB